MKSYVGFRFVLYSLLQIYLLTFSPLRPLAAVWRTPPLATKARCFAV